MSDTGRTIEDRVADLEARTEATEAGFRAMKKRLDALGGGGMPEAEVVQPAKARPAQPKKGHSSMLLAVLGVVAILAVLVMVATNSDLMSPTTDQPDDTLVAAPTEESADDDQAETPASPNQPVTHGRASDAPVSAEEQAVLDRQLKLAKYLFVACMVGTSNDSAECGRRVQKEYPQSRDKVIALWAANKHTEGVKLDDCANVKGNYANGCENGNFDKNGYWWDHCEKHSTHCPYHTKEWTWLRGEPYTEQAEEDEPEAVQAAAAPAPAAAPANDLTPAHLKEHFTVYWEGSFTSSDSPYDMGGIKNPGGDSDHARMTNWPWTDKCNSVKRCGTTPGQLSTKKCGSWFPAATRATQAKRTGASAGGTDLLEEMAADTAEGEGEGEGDEKPEPATKPAKRLGDMFWGPPETYWICGPPQ